MWKAEEVSGCSSVLIMNANKVMKTHTAERWEIVFESGSVMLLESRTN